MRGSVYSLLMGSIVDEDVRGKKGGGEEREGSEDARSRRRGRGREGGEEERERQRTSTTTSLPSNLETPFKLVQAHSRLSSSPSALLYELASRKSLLDDLTDA